MSPPRRRCRALRRFGFLGVGAGARLVKLAVAVSIGQRPDVVAVHDRDFRASLDASARIIALCEWDHAARPGASARTRVGGGPRFPDYVPAMTCDDGRYSVHRVLQGQDELAFRELRIIEQFPPLPSSLEMPYYPVRPAP